MRIVMLATWLGLATAGTAVAGHPPDVAKAAHRFANAAEHLHHQLHRTRGHYHEGIDSHKLARAAEHFHRQVEHGGSRRHLRGDFRELRGQYEHLKRQVRHTGVLRRHHHIGDDYEAMHHAFHRLEKAIAVARHRAHRYERDRHRGRYDRGRDRHHRNRGVRIGFGDRDFGLHIRLR